MRMMGRIKDKVGGSGVSGVDPVGWVESRFGGEQN